MVKMLLKKFKVKKEGSSELFASLFAIVAMTLFILFFVNAIGDVDAKTQIDQVARSYILRMESSGNLTTDEINSLKSELMKIKAVKDAVDNGGQITVTFNGDNKPRGYGKTITLNIKCPVITTTFDSEGNIMGLVDKNKITYFEVNRQSTAKY